MFNLLYGKVKVILTTHIIYIVVVKYNRWIYRPINFRIKLIKRDLFVFKFPTGDLKESKYFPLATRVKTVKILLVVIRIIIQDCQ